MPNEELAQQLKDAALLRGEFTLRSGRKSSYYFDKYRFETAPELLRVVARHLAAMLPEDTERLAGAELGGVPLVTAVALETGLPFVIVRRAGKGYGTQRRIEGVLQEGERVALVEDVATTAGAALQAVQALREAGAGEVSVLLVLDRQEGAAEAFAEAAVPFHALFTSESLGIEEEP
jgi:orotate phosphoribosyltransferase